MVELWYPVLQNWESKTITVMRLNCKFTKSSNRLKRQLLPVFSCSQFKFIFFCQWFKKQVIIIHSSEENNRAIEKWSNLPKFTQLVSAKARIWTWEVWLQSPYSWCSFSKFCSDYIKCCLSSNIKDPAFMLCFGKKIRTLLSFAENLLHHLYSQGVERIQKIMPVKYFHLSTT